MSRLAIAFALSLAATAVNAQTPTSGQHHAPAAASIDTTRPFLFDAVLPGDPVHRKARADDHHRAGGAIVVPPKSNQHGQDR